MRDKSFTLIELLVVIVIIGILAGVIMISTSSSIDKANFAKAQAFSSTVQDELLSNLVSEWTFDEPEEGGKTKDTWGNNHGTVVGATYKDYKSRECVFGGCYDFNGSANIDFGDILQIGLNSWTYSLWFKGNSFAGTYLLTKTDNGATPFRMALGFNSDSKIYFVFRDETNKHYGLEDEYVANFNPDSNWHNINITIDRNSNLLCYLDGIRIGKRDIQNISNQNFLLNRSFRIGSYTDTSNMPRSFFNGLMDDVRIYNAALSSAQIKQNYIADLNSMLANGNMSKEEYNERINILAKK